MQFNSLTDLHTQNLNNGQRKEVSKMIDEKLGRFKFDIDMKLDKIILLHKTIKDDISDEIKMDLDNSRFRHNKTLAFWVGVACYIATVLGIRTDQFILKVMALLF